MSNREDWNEGWKWGFCEIQKLSLNQSVTILRNKRPRFYDGVAEGRISSSMQLNIKTSWIFDGEDIVLKRTQ